MSAPIHTRKTTMTAQSGKSVKEIVKKIREHAKTFIENKKNANNLIDIISLTDTEHEEILLASIKSFHKIFVKAISNEDMFFEKPPNCEEDLSTSDKYKMWLRSRYDEAQNHLLRMLLNKDSSVQELALCTLMKFVEAEGRSPLRKITGNHLHFPATLFELVITAFLRSEQDLSPLIGRFQEYMEYDDVRYFTMKLVLKDLKTAQEDKPEAHLTNIYSLLENLTMPATGEEDKVTKFISKYPENAENLKINSFKEQKKLFTTVWLLFLKQKLSTSLYKKVLMVLHDKVMPHMTSPLLLSDFLTNSYNIGGAISLLALNGLFILVHNYNLEYPDFYKKLYALFEPTVFHVKYRARFFFLSDLFLTSTHLPSYLVAAFTKRLSRLALAAPPSCLTIIIPFVYNLLIRHPSVQVLVHRTDSVSDFSVDPFDMDEEDPAACKALQSSLWEIKTLQSHYHHTIGVEARKLDQLLPNQEIVLGDLLETSVDELVEKETKKKIKTAPTNFEVPRGLFANKDPMSEFWTLS